MNERNIPEQNQPIHSYENKTSPTFNWIVGGLSTLMLTVIFYILNRLDNLETKIASHYEALDSKYRADHDKIIKLETILELKKN